MDRVAACQAPVSTHGAHPAHMQHTGVHLAHNVLSTPAHRVHSMHTQLTIGLHTECKTMTHCGLSAGWGYGRCSVRVAQGPRVGPSSCPDPFLPSRRQLPTSCLPTASSPSGPFEDALKLHECSVAAGAVAPLPLEDQWPSPPTRRAPIAPTEEQLRQEPWYHGQMSRRAAEKLLRADGDFLVRDSVTNPGQYVLTGMHAGQPKHLLLVDPEGVVRRPRGGARVWGGDRGPTKGAGWGEWGAKGVGRY